MIKKLCTYLLTGSILASTVLSPLQTYAADFEPESKIELDESTEELLNEEKEEVDSTENLDDEEIVEDIIVSENDENKIIPDDFSEEEVEEVIDFSDEEEIVEEEILDIDEENTEEDTTETELVETELTVDIENYTVSATGNMPENAELTVSIIEDTVDLENQVNETLPEFEKFTVYKAFNIDILVAGEKWQPVDFDELVSISIKNIDVSAIKEELFTDEVVYNSATEEIEELTVDTVNDTVFRVEDEEVTELTPTVSENNVEFETEHFTIFAFGGVDYNTDTATATYTAGDDITAYWFSDKGLIAFVGTGDMYDWKSTTAPWFDIITSITDVYFSEEIISIGNCAFNFCTNLALTSELPSRLTSIGDDAFYQCENLALSGSLPAGLTSIGEGAFSGCTSLALTGSLPSGLTSIGAGAFSGCTSLALTGELPSGLTSISSYAFEGCTNLALSGSLPSGLTSIGNRAFVNCTNLALSGELPSGLTSISDASFSGCKNLALTGSLPEGLESIGSRAFYYCTNLALTGSLPSGLTSIGSYAFDGCINLAITGDIPSNISSIEGFAFAFKNVDSTKTYFERNLSDVEITSAMKIPTLYTVVDTFSDGKKADVTITKYGYVGETSSAGTAPTYSGYTLKTDCTDATITIGSTDADRLTLTRVYKAKVFTYNGKDYYDADATTTYAAGDNITAYWYESDGVLGFVGTGDMYDHNEIPWPWDSIRDNITNVYLSDEITYIGTEAFWSCTNLALTELPSGLTEIGSSAFYRCTNLALTELPSGLTTIGNSAFNSCANLALTELPSGLTSIGNSAFSECTNLALTELPSGLTTIGKFAFYDCTNLALSGSLPSGLTTIGDSAFDGCTNLALTGELPSGLTSIGQAAFKGCTNLALTGDLPENITSIGRNIFYGVDPEKTHFDNNLSSVSITSAMYVPTSYTVVDTFTDGKKTDVVTTKYGFVGATSSVGTTPTYEVYTLKTDCTDAPITIGATDADRLSLTREFQRNYQPVNAEIYVSTTINDNPVGDMYSEFMFSFLTTDYSDNAGGFTDMDEEDGLCDFCGKDGENCTCPDGLCDSCGMPENKCCCTCVWQHFMPDPDGTLMFVTKEISADDIGKKYRYIVVEDIPVDSEKMQGMTYDTTEFLVEVEVTVENDSINPVLKYTNKNTGEEVDSIVFNNIYENPNKFITSYKGKDYYRADATNEWSLQKGFTAYWFEDDGFLYFDGTGEMPAFGIESRPWHGFNVTDVKFNDNITYIGSQLVHGFTTLTDVVLPSSLKEIGDGAFAGCTNLENMTELNEGLEVIGWHSFQNCKNLKLAQELPSTLKKIGWSAFINSGVAFSGELPSGIEDIGFVAFEGCKNLNLSGDIPESVTNIGGGAFNGCLNSCFERNLSDYKITDFHTVPTRFTVVDLDDADGKELGRKDFVGYVGYEYKATVSDTEYERYSLSDAKDKGNLVIDKVGTHTILYRKWTADTYTITFEDFDGREISKHSYTYGATVDVPANPKRDGYTFRTWSPVVEKVTGGRTYKAVYSRNGYTVKFIADGKELVNKVYYYGEYINVPVVPEKAGYVFKGWDKPINARCEENVTYTAVYDKEAPIPATYTIKFKDYDGELISSKTYTEGDTIKVPSDPTRSGYEFDGWSPEVSETADADATYKATYTKKEPVVTPDPIKPDVTPITPTPTPVTPAPEVEEETKPKTPVEEEVEENEKDDEPEEIKVIIPDKSDNPEPKTIEIPKKTYKITFVDDEGNVISSKYYKEGDAVSIPEAPEKENFEFTNWSPAFSTKAVADAEYKPIYKEVKKEEPVAPAPEEPVDKPKTPIQKAVPAIVAGVVTTGILATGYFSGLWLFLANLLFVKRRKKWHGLLNLEENGFVKNILDESEDDVYIEDVWAKSNGNVDDFVENMKSLKTATLLPVGTRMFVYLGDGVEVLEYKDADEKKFFDALKDNLDAFGKVTLELRHDKFSVDIEVTFEAPLR